MTNNPTNIAAKRSICNNKIEKLPNEGIASALVSKYFAWDE